MSGFDAREYIPHDKMADCPLPVYVELNALKAENTRLREALERIVKYEQDLLGGKQLPGDPDKFNYTDAQWMVSIARAALGGDT